MLQILALLKRYDTTCFIEISSEIPDKQSDLV